MGFRGEEGGGGGGGGGVWRSEQEEVTEDLALHLETTPVRLPFLTQRTHCAQGQAGRHPFALGIPASLSGLSPGPEDLVDDPVLLSGLGGEVRVPGKVAQQLLLRLSRLGLQALEHVPPNPKQLPCLVPHVGAASPRRPAGQVHHDPGVGQRKPLALGA